MGIAGFQKWLVATFPEAVTKVKPARRGRVGGRGGRGGGRGGGGQAAAPPADPATVDSFDHVCIDFAQLIHTNARKSADPPMLVALIFQEVDRLLRTLVPRKSVYFAFDGPAPLAKLMTQRARRAKQRARDGGADDAPAAGAPADAPAPVEEGPPPTAEELAAAARAAARQRRKARYRVARGDGVDPLAMAPGTELMAYLASSIEYWCVSRLQSDRRYEHVTAIVSGPHVAGEGELKIIDYLHTSVAPSDSVVIVGSDADIILQGVLTTCVRDFFVYVGGAPRQPAMLLSVWVLVRLLDDLFPGESAAVRADFVVLCLLNGNDYLPKLRGSNFPRLWNRYKQLKKAPGKRESGEIGRAHV